MSLTTDLAFIHFNPYCTCKRMLTILNFWIFISRFNRLMQPSTLKKLASSKPLNYKQDLIFYPFCAIRLVWTSSFLDIINIFWLFILFGSQDSRLNCFAFTWTNDDDMVELQKELGKLIWRKNSKREWKERSQIRHAKVKKPSKCLY